MPPRPPVSPAPPVRKKRPAVWIILVAAVLAWFLAGVTSAALLAAADADEHLATLFALIALLAVLAGGFVGRHRSG